MTALARLRKWREVKRRPVQGNSPNDRILHGPDCYRPKRVCADSFPATPLPEVPGMQEFPGMRFGEACGIYRSDGMGQNHSQDRADAASRWSAPRLWATPRIDHAVL